MKKTLPFRYRVIILIFFLIVVTFLDRVCISLVGVTKKIYSISARNDLTGYLPHLHCRMHYLNYQPAFWRTASGTKGFYSHGSLMVIDFKSGNALALAFEDNHFGFAFNRYILHRIDESLAGIKEMKRICKP